SWHAEPGSPAESRTVFVYADGRVIWYPGPAYVDGGGRVTAIAIDPIGGNPGAARLWLTESGLERGIVPPGPAIFPEGEYRNAILERRLNARGLALVRAGKLDLRYFLVNWNVDRDGQLHRVRFLYQRKRLWAEPTGRIWQPSHYAICAQQGYPDN